MNADERRICEVLTTVRDCLVSWHTARELGDPDLVRLWNDRTRNTVSGWLSPQDLVTAILLLLSGESRDMAERVVSGLALVTETGAAGVEFPAANGTPGLPSGRVSSVSGVNATPDTCPNEGGTPWTG